MLEFSWKLWKNGNYGDMETVFQDIKQVLGSLKAEVHFPNDTI